MRLHPCRALAPREPRDEMWTAVRDSFRVSVEPGVTVRSDNGAEPIASVGAVNDRLRVESIEFELRASDGSASVDCIELLSMLLVGTGGAGGVGRSSMTASEWTICSVDVEPFGEGGAADMSDVGMSVALVVGWTSPFRCDCCDPRSRNFCLGDFCDSFSMVMGALPCQNNVTTTPGVHSSQYAATTPDAQRSPRYARGGLVFFAAQGRVGGGERGAATTPALRAPPRDRTTHTRTHDSHHGGERAG